jgi:hypothetical protein
MADVRYKKINQNSNRQQELSRWRGFYMTESAPRVERRAADGSKIMKPKPFRRADYAPEALERTGR